MHATDPVNRFMTVAVLTVDINDPAGEVLRLFAGYPVHHLPVLDERRVVGMLSSADLMKLDQFVPKNGVAPIEYLNQRLKVGALVRRAAITIQPHQSVGTAAQLMAANGIHSLAVVDSADHLLGIITTTDIMHAAFDGHGDGALPGAATVSSGGAECVTALSAEQMAQALASAVARAGTDSDPDHVHRALLNLQARVAPLEQVRQCADRYLQAGQDEQLHAALLRALEAVGRSEHAGNSEALPGLC